MIQGEQSTVRCAAAKHGWDFKEIQQRQLYCNPLPFTRFAAHWCTAAQLYRPTIDMQDFRCSPQCELADCIILHLFKCSNVQCLCSTVQCQPNCCAPPPSSDRCSMNENSLLLGKLAESRISLINNCKLDRAPTWQLLSFRPRVINAKWLKST